MKTTGSIAALLLLATVIRAQPAGKEIQGFRNPESVIVHQGKAYVSNIGDSLAPLQKDGDGFISKVDLATGKIETLHFLPMTGKLHAPKGSAVMGNVLYVADIDRVVGFDLKTRKTVFDLTIEGATFLNDMVAANGKLLVTATDNGRIYAIDIKEKKAKPLPIDVIPGANGICYDAATGLLYCVGFSKDGQSANGSVYEIDLVQQKVTAIPGYEGFLDGAAVGNGRLWFSDWKSFDKSGVLMTMDLKTHAFQQVPGAPIAGPADFTISPDGHFLILPGLLEGKLLWRNR